MVYKIYMKSFIVVLRGIFACELNKTYTYFNQFWLESDLYFLMQDLVRITNTMCIFVVIFNNKLDYFVY